MANISIKTTQQAKNSFFILFFCFFVLKPSTAASHKDKKGEKIASRTLQRAVLRHFTKEQKKVQVLTF
jgi:hypothetical protein